MSIATKTTHAYANEKRPGARWATLRMPRLPDSMPLVVAIIGALLSLALAVYVAHWERQASRSNLIERAGERLKVLEATLAESMEVLHGLASLYRAVGALEQPQFRDFAARAIARHPNLQAVEWIPRVAHGERAMLEERQRSSGIPEFRFTEFDTRGTVQAAGARAEYFPVYLVEPLPGNRAAHGFDLATHPERRAALERARDTGLPAATAPIRLAQEQARQQGFLVFLPVYAGNPATPAERHQALRGFALVVFRAGNLLAGTFEDLLASGVDVAVRDARASQAPLLQQHGAIVPSRWPALWRVGGLTWETRLAVAGRDWHFVFAPNRFFIAQHPPWQTIISLIVGLALTTLLVAYLRGTARRTRQIDAANSALQLEVRERERAERTARAANRAKSEFLASMGHEIRTPLNAVLGYAQLLRRDDRLDRDQRESANAIIVSGNHLLSHINDVLDLSKIESGRSELRLETLEINDLLRELELMFRPRCKEKKLLLRVEPLPQPYWSRGDQCKLRQILINLCGNAVRFTLTGEVFLGCRIAPDQRIRFDVIDTGPGIAAEDLGHIFEPFFQSPRHGPQGGTGLGLTIARRLSELMGGTLDVASELGSGTRFTLQLPLPRAAPSTSTAAPEVVGWKLRSGTPLRALVVDDIAANRDLLLRVLRDAGVDADGAATCAETLEHARTYAYHIVFMDIRLPDGDGLGVVRALRSVTPHTVVIGYSALAFDQDRERCREAGCIDFLEKPLRAEALFECLERRLGVGFERRYRCEESLLLPRMPDYTRLRVPEDLLTQLLTAADLHSTTVLKSSLDRLEGLGEEERLLAENIRQCMRAYDMEGVARLLVNVAHCAAYA